MYKTLCIILLCSLSAILCHGMQEGKHETAPQCPKIINVPETTDTPITVRFDNYSPKRKTLPPRYILDTQRNTVDPTTGINFTTLQRKFNNFGKTIRLLNEYQKKRDLAAEKIKISPIKKNMDDQKPTS